MENITFEDFKKILLMIMGESVVITVISAIVGTIMGVIGVELMKI